MSFSIRELEDRDWDAVAALIDSYDEDGYNGQHLRESDARWIPGDPKLRLVAESEGEIVGSARCLRRSEDRPGQFRAMVYVAKAHTGAGIGQQLAGHLQEFAVARGGNYIDCFVKDVSERGRDFAERAGCKPVQHLFESSLQISTVDVAPFLARKRNLEAQGYSFFSLAEAGDTEENRRKLHELDCDADEDTPGFENWGRRSYEQYSIDEHQSHGYTPHGILIAAHQDRWVAMNAIRPTPAPRKMRTDFTGVRREHRGLGLAQVMKALGIQYAQSEGIQVITTHNDERNAGMLAVNRKLGFIPQPGFVVYRKMLTV
jgi:mycothiol synthase